MVSLKLSLVLATITISSSFQFGYQTGVINAPLELISEFIRNTSESRGHSVTDVYVRAVTSFCVTAFLIGGMIGALLSGIMANKLGRKKSIVYLSFFCVVGCIALMICEVAKSFEVIIFGRLIIGFACGAYTAIAPMYMSEIAPSSIRGAAGVLNQLVIVASLFLSQVLGLPSLMGTSRLWPYLLGLNLFPCVFGALALLKCPESPRYLFLIKGDTVASREALQWLRGPSCEVQDEFDEYARESLATQSKTGLWGILRSSNLRLALLVAFFAQFGQQLSGMNGLLYYSGHLFRANGLSEEQSTYATLGVGLVLLIVTIISVFIIDRVGRRVLLIGGVIDAFVSLLIFTACLLIKRYTGAQWPIYVAITFIYIFVCGIAIGPGSIPWFIAAELFSQETRDAASSAAITVNWICNIAIGLGFIQLIAYIDVYAFLPSACILLIVIVFLLRYMPETMGRNTEVIEAHFKRFTRGDRLSVAQPLEPTASFPDDQGYANFANEEQKQNTD